MTFKHLLFVRMDRIGDLILTLPVDQLPYLQDSKVDWIITKGLAPFAESAVPPRKFSEASREFSVGTFFSFFRSVRAGNYDGAVVFHAPWWVSAALWLARVPVRVGPKSQWHSFLFLNRTLRQKRSEAKFHEFEYNHRLVLEGLGQSNLAAPLRPLQLTASQGDKTLHAYGLTNRQYFVVHPGMGGSARNWPAEFYVEWIRRMSAESQVVVTGTPGDAAWLEPIRAALSHAPSVIWLDGKLSTKDWLAVLGGAKAVLAPSTGTIHAAASLGVPTLGIYSPVKVQAPRRWAPLGNFAKALVPQVDCPGHFECLGEKCEYYDCMKRLTPDQVVGEIRRLVSEAGSK